MDQGTVGKELGLYSMNSGPPNQDLHKADPVSGLGEYGFSVRVKGYTKNLKRSVEMNRGIIVIDI